MRDGSTHHAPMGVADGGEQPHKWTHAHRILIHRRQDKDCERVGHARAAKERTTHESSADFDSIRILTGKDRGLRVRLREQFLSGTHRLRSGFHGRQEHMALCRPELLRRTTGQEL